MTEDPCSVGVAGSPLPPKWPAPPNEPAFRGLAGDFVRAVEPFSEADPVALLAQFLAYFGAVVGRGPHVRVEDDRHGVNEFLVLVGDTAKGRKGTSRGRIHRLFEPLDPDWALERIARGLSSGEGLIWSVRDAMEAEQAAQVQGAPTARRRPAFDPGEKDKRLLVLDAEFASTLHVMERSGNTLSPVLRTAWDGEVLRILTKNWPAKATDTHISIIGHVTKDEVLRYLDRTEVANGFANRFIWVAVRRSKLLPEGGQPPAGAMAGLAARLAACVSWASGVGELRRSTGMRALWARVYPTLSQSRPGLLGAILARSEAHVLRLSCVYALLDMSDVIEQRHLESALALWEYAERSAKYVFGEALGDPLADEILEQLRRREAGLSRTEIRDLFSKHGLRAQIDRALNGLGAAGLARMQRTPTAGRPEERWFALVDGGEGSAESADGSSCLMSPSSLASPPVGGLAS